MPTTLMGARRPPERDQLSPISPGRPMNPADLDVAIIGGGLAGGLFARQLRRALPHLRVGLFERSPTTSFKVGESSVELFSNYLIRRLGLSSYLYTSQLPKNGLRFFFDTPRLDAELSEMSEIGNIALPFHPSFQLDRARLEADLHHLNRQDGVVIRLGAKVEQVALAAGGNGRLRHRLSIRTPDGLAECQCRWVVDASGRASVLARQERLRVPEPGHQLTAGWARFQGVSDVDACGPEAFRRRVRYSSRMLSTVHFCYRGSWIWFIPLGRGVTSVGVVGERDTPGLEQCRTKEGLLEFLARHRAVSSLLASARLLDFGTYRHLAYGTRRYFSGDGWGLIGEAADFSDPFYSPGSDFIALENDLLTDLIRRDDAGEPAEALGQLADLYSQYMAFRHEASMRLYRRLYPTFGSYELLNLKRRFDIALYYHKWFSPFLQDLHLDPEFLRREMATARFVLGALGNVADLFERIERALRATDRYHRANLGRFSEPLEGISFVREVGAPMSRRADLKRQSELFNTARLQGLELLGELAEGVPRVPIPLSRFAGSQPLVASRPALVPRPQEDDLGLAGASRKGRAQDGQGS